MEIVAPPIANLLSNLLFASSLIWRGFLKPNRQPHCVALNVVITAFGGAKLAKKNDKVKIKVML